MLPLGTLWTFRQLVSGRSADGSLVRSLARQLSTDQCLMSMTSHKLPRTSTTDSLFVACIAERFPGEISAGDWKAPYNEGRLVTNAAILAELAIY